MSEQINTSTPMDVQEETEVIVTPTLTSHFNIVNANLAAFKNHVSTMQHQLRQLERSVGKDNLQDTENRKIIRPDEALKVLLKIAPESDELTYFNLQKFMNPHFKAAVITSA